ncbi:uncharacterized protein J3D65DRAFT_19005 [Phyllosticta citribraziliensis]|uniref:Uncharacterized protein n=1 Tax=Phyllosticta citribraziliensis TaxID=989973 RepID=A0ABR1M967_9PEZI
MAMASGAGGRLCPAGIGCRRASKEPPMANSASGLLFFYPEASVSASSTPDLNTSPLPPSPLLLPPFAFEPSFTRRLFSGQSSGQRGTAGPHRRHRSASTPSSLSRLIRTEVTPPACLLLCTACRVRVRSCNGLRSTLPLSPVLLCGSRPTRQLSPSSASTAGRRIPGHPRSQNSWLNGNFPHSPDSLTSDPDLHPSADSLIRALPPENHPPCGELGPFKDKDRSPSHSGN